MPRAIRAVVTAAFLILLPIAASAQDTIPPLVDEPIGPFVFDARATIARFKQDVEVAAALGVQPADLPTRGLGLVVGAHVYPVRKRSFALGLGGEILLRARGSHTIPPTVEDGPDGPTIITRLSAVSPQVSLNFGKRNGWSYLSGGIGWSNLTTEFQDDPFEDPESNPRTINYGGGARWFAKKHLAVSVDLRFYSISAQEATAARPGVASTRMMVFSAGVALR